MKAGTGDNPVGLSCEEEDALRFSSDEDIDMDGELDALTRDKLAVYYPSGTRRCLRLVPYNLILFPEVSSLCVLGTCSMVK